MTAGKTYVLKDNRTGKESEYFTEFRFEKKESSFVFEFFCEKSCRFSACEGFNTAIYKGDVCEIFISVGGDRNVYYELEVAPNNSRFFKKIVFDGEQRHATEVADSFSSQVKNYKNGYSVVMEVPFKSIEYREDVETFFNAYRIETENGETDKFLLALSPTLSGSYHKPKYFVEM